MTRRERLERKLERREEWAQKAKERANAHFKTTDRICEHIPMGQPILVGHHSERHARRDQARIEYNMSAGVNELNKAKHHNEKAAGLEMQLKRSIFSDDDNAIEAIEERIRKNEELREQYKRINAAWKKNGEQGVRALGFGDTMIETIKRNMVACSWDSKPFPTWETTNLSARIRSDKQRIEQIKRQQTRHEEAEAAGGIVIKGTDDYCSITFAEKPDRSVLNALKAAGFCWSGGSWHGRRDQIPEGVQP